MTQIPKRCVGNIRFSVISLQQAVETLVSLAAAQAPHSSGSGVAVHFANAYNIALARNDHKYADLLNSADLVLSDGVPVTWVGRRAYPQHKRIWERVYGPDVMTMVLERSTSQQPRHYLLGSTPRVLAQLNARIAARFPNALIVGRESPPFHEPAAQELLQRDVRIQESGATMVWVGLGTPKQDVEVARLARNLPVVALAVGAAFDFLAETTAQAPEWMQRSGMEWAFRLASEPRRLGKRYIWGNSVFLLEAARTLKRRDQDADTVPK